jgi:seryl-tRNA synthetase
MPLVTIEILENKIKELLLVLNHLKNENELLKKQIGTDNKAEISSDIQFELEKLKEQISKYKNNKVVVTAKIKKILDELNEIIGKEQNG